MSGWVHETVIVCGRCGGEHYQSECQKPPQPGRFLTPREFYRHRKSWSWKKYFAEIRRQARHLRKAILSRR